MSSLEKHCEESLKLYGATYEWVHKWLDEFAGHDECGYRHRRLRHHEEGIRKAVELFGETAGEVARLHIMSDLKEEGWTENDPFPKSEAHYIEMGLY